MGLEVSLMGIHPEEERSPTFVGIEWKTPVLRPAIQLNQSFLCSPVAAETEERKTRWLGRQHKESS